MYSSIVRELRNMYWKFSPDRDRIRLNTSFVKVYIKNDRSLIIIKLERFVKFQINISYDCGNRYLINFECENLDAKGFVQVVSIIEDILQEFKYFKVRKFDYPIINFYSNSFKFSASILPIYDLMKIENVCELIIENINIYKVFIEDSWLTKNYENFYIFHRMAFNVLDKFSDYK